MHDPAGIASAAVVDAAQEHRVERGLTGAALGSLGGLGRSGDHLGAAGGVTGEALTALATMRKA